MLKIRYGRIKGHAFLFKYETTVELKQYEARLKQAVALSLARLLRNKWI